MIWQAIGTIYFLKQHMKNILTYPGVDLYFSRFFHYDLVSFFIYNCIKNSQNTGDLNLQEDN